MSKRFNMIKWHAKGVKLGDSRYVIDHLQLGKIASNDWADSRVLDRMMLYERRIESSMTRIMNELKKQQIMRRIEQQDEDEQYEPSPSLRDEAATRSNSPSPSLRDEAATRRQAEKKGNLKKQTQFAPEQIVTKSYKEGDYVDIPAGRIEENKAKQSQSPALEQTKGAGKGKKSPAAANLLTG